MAVQPVSRQGDTLSTGHLCDATTTLAAPGQGTVFAEGALIARIGDPTVVHDLPNPSPPPACIPHTATVGSGSPTVYVAGIKAAFITAAADAGAMTSGAPTVFVATAKSAVTAKLGVTVFTPNVGTPAEIEAFSQEAYAGIEVEEAALGVDVANSNDLGEYGDGGIASARFSNTSPTNNVAGVQNTEVAAGGTSPSTFEPGSGSALNFLPHTDPRVDPRVIDFAQATAAALGLTLTITSAYRSPEYNASVGGARNSMHVQGLAIDVVQTGLTDAQRQAFIQQAYNAGFRGFGIYNTFTHVDIGATRAWGSGGSRRDLPKYPWAQATLGALGYATS